MATLDKDTLREALEEAVVVIDAEDFQRSRRDPRVRDLFERGEALLAELDAKGANRQGMMLAHSRHSWQLPGTRCSDG